MKNLIEMLLRCVRGNLIGLFDENDGYERLVCVGIWNFLIIFVFIMNDKFNL